MKILAANIGSTSYKYKLFDMTDERVLAEGQSERIGQPGGDSQDMASAVDRSLRVMVAANQLKMDLSDLSGVGFKVVHAKGLTHCLRVDGAVLKAMEEFAFLLPAHNPPYLEAMRAFQALAPRLPQVALFETAFFDLDPAADTFAVPWEWRESYHVRRYGFHGASHRWASDRAIALTGRNQGLRHISCHLGGSSSIAAVRDGRGVDTSFGMTPQSGIPQNNRVGDMDVFAVLYMMKILKLDPDATGEILAQRSGLAGISGTSGDMREIEAAAAQGSERARTALGAFVYAVRKHIGNFLLQLGGVDIITFSGGIGEKSPQVRGSVLRGMESFGVRLDPVLNDKAKGGAEIRISDERSTVPVWVVRTNEELVVARATKEDLVTAAGH